MKTFLIIFIALFIQACSYNLGELSIISTRDIDMNAQYVQIATNVQGIGTTHFIVFLPTRFSPITIEEIVNDALLKTGGDFMTNCLISSFQFYIPYIYGQNKLIIEGDIWKKQSSEFGGINLDEVIKEQNVYVFDDNELKSISNVIISDGELPK